MPTLPRPPHFQLRRLPAGVLLGVLALHVVLLAVATRLGVWPDRVPAPPEAPPLVLWLLDRQPPGQAASNGPPAAALPRRQLDPRVASPAPSHSPSPPTTAPVEPQAITLPTPSAEAAGEVQRAPETVGPSAPAPAALNLALSRAASAAWRQRSAALADPRSNTRAPVHLAALLDKALGGDPYGAISEERLADGSVRFRRGAQCVISRPNQAQNLDPFNGSVMPKPRLLDKC